MKKQQLKNLIKAIVKESLTTRSELDTGTMKAVNVEEAKNLSVPEKHQLRIALQTLKMSDVGANIMGGMNKDEAREFLRHVGYSDAAIQKLEGGVSEGMHDSKPCNCGSGLNSFWAMDARGIPLKRVCPKCREEKLKGYRQDVLKNPDYEADEPIEPDDYEESVNVKESAYLKDAGIPLSDDEKIMIIRSINTFSRGGHPAPDMNTVGHFGQKFVLSMLDKAVKLLSKKPDQAKNLALTKALIQKLSAKPLKEMSATGGVAGYSTPFAFTKNKKGSPRGIAAAKKYGKVVGESPRV